MKELIINRTWDDKVLEPAQHAKMSVAWCNNGDLTIYVDAPFANDPKPDCDKASCWELWNYEVVELFLVGAGEPAPYLEIEISPWGHHLVLKLLGRRNMIAQQLPLEIIQLNRNETRWQAQARIDADLIPKGLLKVNAYRISGVEPNRHYHVMTPLKGTEPDFHHIDQFTQELSR